MIVSRIVLKNWRNFEAADVVLSERAFLVGPNAAGKSNFLDAFKFIRDLALPGGGLQKAIADRGGVPQIRCLAARSESDIGITIELKDVGAQSFAWKYEVGIKLQTRGDRVPYIAREKVWKNGESEPFINRPDKDDDTDKKRLTQTHLEQINANSTFREINNFCQEIKYLHLVPQLIKYPDAFRGKKLAGDPFGLYFLESVAATTPKTRDARLKKIDRALTLAVPQLGQLSYKPDETFGIPHLEAKFKHWRPGAGKQREDQFSDGTLRLIGLLWALLSGESLLLLEEPELSLHKGIVSQLAPLVRRLQRGKNGRRQVILSTHSEALLEDHGIDPREVLMLIPSKEGNTSVVPASTDDEVVKLLSGGMNLAEAVIPMTYAKGAHQLLFKF